MYRQVFVRSEKHALALIKRAGPVSPNFQAYIHGRSEAIRSYTAPSLGPNQNAWCTLSSEDTYTQPRSYAAGVRLQLYFCSFCGYWRGHHPSTARGHHHGKRVLHPPRRRGIIFLHRARRAHPRGSCASALGYDQAVDFALTGLEAPDVPCRGVGNWHPPHLRPAL